MGSSARYAPGTVISVPVFAYGGWWDHFGILTDRWGRGGERTVAAISMRAGRAVHQFLHEFHGGRQWRVSPLAGTRSGWEVVQHAFADVRAGRAWSIVDNCEHAVRRWHGLPEVSPQLQSTVGTLVLGAAIVGAGVAAARSSA